MKPLIVLLTSFLTILFLIKIFRGDYAIALSGRVAMSVMLVFTAIAHFTFTKGMVLMLPEFLPNKTEIIYLTGVLEVAAAIGFFIPGLKTITGWLLIAFFILILPANILASLKEVNIQKATFDGNGVIYLWFRIPLQVFFILWTYLSTIKA